MAQGKKRKKKRYKYPTRELLAVWMILQISCQKSISEARRSSP